MKAGLLRLVPPLAGFAVIVIAVLLGNWQLRRAQEKSLLQQQFERLAEAPPQALRADAAHAPEGLPLRLEGRWRPAASLYLDNRTHAGRAGYHVLTPLQLADGSGWVLVNRGWVAAGGDRRLLPEVAAPADGVVEGRLRRVERAPYTLAAEPAGADGRLWQFVDVELYRRDRGLAVAGWVVLQTSPAVNGLVRDWPPPDAGIDRHRAYAVQWYALAALAAALCARPLWRGLTRSLHDRRHPA